MEGLVCRLPRCARVGESQTSYVVRAREQFVQSGGFGRQASLNSATHVRPDAA